MVMGFCLLVCLSVWLPMRLKCVRQTKHRRPTRSWKHYGSVAHSKSQSRAAVYLPGMLISAPETHYKVKGRCSQCSIWCSASNPSRKKKPKAFKVSLSMSSPSPPKLADPHHAPKHRLARIARGTKWHFQHKHMIMCADLSVRLLLAQPVS